MNLEEWEKHWAAFEKRMAEIDAIYEWKVNLIARHRGIATFFLTGYVVLIGAGIVFTNYVVMLFAIPCALGVIASVLWMSYLIHKNPYPGEKR